MLHLPETEYQVASARAAGGPTELGALAEGLGQDQSRVHAASVALAERGYLLRDEQPYRVLELAEGSPAAAGDPLPERLVLEGLDKAGGQARVPDLPQHCPLQAREVGQSLRWLRQKGWATQKGPLLVLSDVGRAALATMSPDEELLSALRTGGAARDDALEARGLQVDAALKLLKGRRGLLKVRERVERTLRLTDAGQEAISGGVCCRPQVNVLTPEMLQDGSWKNVDFRPYDVGLATARVYPGKSHPFRRVLARTRRVFLELGFEEIVSPLVESSFWDFDALFQPQDHPAREMQDTFYVARPGTARLPDPAYVDAVAATHEDGGTTGSVGWRYRFSREVAQRPVLRTHCTAATVRALAAAPQAPRKVFCVGQVFRRETVDYKHLPVFHQVDGVVIDQAASFASLLGILDAFYRKMGFERFEFRPAFFPYTEPSVEIFVWLPERQDWVEMGGAGVFRPEVTEPAGCEHPVLAWGLGLERLAMVRHGLSDIRELYLADLDWLKGAPLCR